jgi:type I restriction enzyme S subunit
MQKLFSQEIRFKDENGNDFPDWQEFKLNQVVTPIKRRLKQAIETVLTISAKRGFLLQADRFSQIIAGNSLEKYTHLKKGEFSYNRGNSKTYTYGCIYKLDDYEEALVPNIYRSFTLNKGCTEFFAQLFKNKYLDRQLRRLISSSARMDGLLNIGEKDFYEVKVPFPTEAEQKKIGAFLNELDKKLELVSQQIEQTQTFKKGLLQQMFV